MTTYTPAPGGQQVLSLADNGKGGVRIYAPMSMPREEKIRLLRQALEYVLRVKPEAGRPSPS